MAARPRCKNCRRAFTPNFRLRSRSPENARCPPQRYCSREVCRVASRRASQKRHRRNHPELPVKIAHRGAAFRRRHPHYQAERRQARAGPPTDSTAAGADCLQTGRPVEAVTQIEPVVHAVARLLRPLIRKMAVAVARQTRSLQAVKPVSDQDLQEI